MEQVYVNCLKCGSDDISIITIKNFNKDSYKYDYYYGIRCDNCGYRAPIEFTTIEDALEAWNMCINWDLLN